jgi:hypothetical protein
MTLLPLSDEADCLAHQHENRVGFLSTTTTADRSPLPRERFSPLAESGHRWHQHKRCDAPGCRYHGVRRYGHMVSDTSSIQRQPYAMKNAIDDAIKIINGIYLT